MRCSTPSASPSFSTRPRILTPPLTPQQAAARQRLEFLGDAAWNFAVADTAFHLWPSASAGDLTRLRATWSSRSGLARLARQFALPLPDVAGGQPTAGDPEPQEDASVEELPVAAPEASQGGEAIRPAPTTSRSSTIPALEAPARLGGASGSWPSCHGPRP